MALGAESSVAFQERNVAGSRFRYATPEWYQLSMGLLKNWPTAADAATKVADRLVAVKLLRLPEANEPVSSEKGRAFVQKAQKQGWGVVMLSQPSPAALVLTKSARDAAALTARDELSYVLSEPSGGWQESARLLALGGFTLTLALGAALSYRLGTLARRHR